MLNRSGTVWLDTARQDIDSGWTDGLLFADPRKVLRAETADDVLPLIEALQEETERGYWVAGALAYEAGYALEPSVFDPPEKRLLGWFGVYDEPLRVSPEDVGAMLSDSPFTRIVDPTFEIERGAYAHRIDQVREHIRLGDVYQINFTAPLHFTVDGNAAGLYTALRERQRVPYSAFLNFGETQVLSFSPELFFRMVEGKITTRPMKGTTNRSATTAEDDEFADRLRNDEKNRAENLMIVDLLRNDISRVAEAGSVGVPELFSIERYETVTQMTSTVEGRLKPGVGLADVFRALFPCGSVTGAPKLRAMRFIRELEGGSRGFYCGAIGYAGPGGQAVFNVPIRTMLLTESKEGRLEGRIGVGSGVVWDSVAKAEYDECLLKARFLTELSG